MSLTKSRTEGHVKVCLFHYHQTLSVASSSLELQLLHKLDKQLTSNTVPTGQHISPEAGIEVGGGTQDDDPLIITCAW